MRRAGRRQRTDPRQRHGAVRAAIISARDRAGGGVGYRVARKRFDAGNGVNSLEALVFYSGSAKAADQSSIGKRAIERPAWASRSTRPAWPAGTTPAKSSWRWSTWGLRACHRSYAKHPQSGYHDANYFLTHFRLLL